MDRLRNTAGKTTISLKYQECPLPDPVQRNQVAIDAHPNLVGTGTTAKQTRT
jgi:hypothetical protein